MSDALQDRLWVLFVRKKLVSQNERQLAVKDANITRKYSVMDIYNGDVLVK